MTGRENIYMNGAIMGMTKAEINRKFDEIVDFSGVERYIDTPAKRYSSGMTVRLGFAIAAHLDPEILVVDEVLAVGDAEFQKKAIGKMQDISKGEGRTVLFVSHNMAMIEKICNRSVLLSNGSIKSDDLTSRIVHEYLKESLSNGLSNNITGVYRLDINNPAKRGILKIETYCDNMINHFFYSNCNFKLKVYFNDHRVNQDSVLGIVIKNDRDEPYIGINNLNCGLKIFEKETQKGWIEIEIPTFSIYGEGYYYVDIFLGNYDSDYEVIENKVKIYLKETDIYLTGKLLSNQLNKIAINKINYYGGEL